MADDKIAENQTNDQAEAPSAVPDSGRPRRAPPTIDLEATEVSREPAPADDEVVRENPAADPTPPPAPKRSTAVVAALTGALAACGVIGAAVWAGWPATPPPVIAPAPDTARLDALTKRLADLEARPAPSPAAAPDATLDARLDALEKAAGALRADLDALRAQEQQTATAVDDIKAAPRVAAAPPPDLAPLTGRIDQLETATRALSSEAAKQRAAPADDKPLRRILAVTVLDRLVRQGDPYVTALASARPLAAQPEAFAPLERFAAAGVPSDNMLSKDLLARIEALAPPAPPKPPEPTGVLDRLMAHAERLVRIRRAGRSAGEGQSESVGRAAAAARRDDVAAARRELSTLTEADRAPFQPWIALVEARDAALAASHQLAADAVAALGKPTP